MKLKSQYQKLKAKERLYEVTVPLIGLTGGIASGKSTVAKMLEKKGLPIINADGLVKEIYQLQETKSFIKSLCPDVMKNDEIQFPLLREKFFKDQGLKSKIENFIYERLPKVFNLALSKIKNAEVIVYDVPLLFEKKMDAFFDVNVLVYTPRKIQRVRLMNRDGHQESMAETILKQQIDIEDKKSQSHFIIDNSQTEVELALEVDKFLRQVMS